MNRQHTDPRRTRAYCRCEDCGDEIYDDTGVVRLDGKNLCLICADARRNEDERD